jgi:hypothetical protein
LRDDNAVGDAALCASQRRFPSDVILLSTVVALTILRNLRFIWPPRIDLTQRSIL